MKLGSREVQMRKVLAVATLGVAGFCGVAACASAGQGSSRPQPSASVLSSSAATTDNSGMARDIARIAVGNGGLAALDNGDGRATVAYCDPGTVSSRPRVGTPVSASCGISYSDGSVWRQTVTVTFGSHGSPVADWTNLGAELVSPAGG
jgi:hypothetical protein